VRQLALDAFAAALNHSADFAIQQAKDGLLSEIAQHN
jgi:hypothetical protein